MAEQSKAAFVRSLPANMPAKDVIAKAKEKSIKLSAGYVYVIRSKGSSGKSKSAGRSGAKGRGGRNGGAEQQFKSLVLDLGLSRSQALLEDVRSRIQRSF